MREINAALAAHLAGDAATLCQCWRLIRHDGVVLGFTDHDHDLNFLSTVFRAQAGLDAAEVTSELGLAIGGGEISGALTAAEITEADITAGLYDDASLEVWLVNWQDLEQRTLLDVGNIGEIKRGQQAFIAEVRGIGHRFDEERGRVYRASCSADLGDARCAINTSSSIYKVEAVVAETRGRLGFVATAPAAFEQGWFTGGDLLWTSGLNDGLRGQVKSHTIIEGLAEISLWQPSVWNISIGDTVELTAGCDKSFSTCRYKYQNATNFRGFPHMPGNDFVVRVPQQGESGLDGGSLFR